MISSSPVSHWKFSTQAPNISDQLSAYHTDGYLSEFANWHHAELSYVIYEGVDVDGWIPLLIKKVNENIFEAFSPYGYSGFVGKLNDKKIEEFKLALFSRNIISCFLRHSPILNNHLGFSPHDLEYNRKTFIVDLTSMQGETFDEVRLHAHQKIRWACGYALKNNVRITFLELIKNDLEDLQQFVNIYELSMISKGASQLYRFNLEHLLRLSEKMKGCVFLALAKDMNNKVIAGAIYITDSTGWSHYHLSACSNVGKEVQVMDLLLMYSHHNLSQMGIRYVHLGGGNEMDGTDGLGRFKKRFSTKASSFYITKYIINTKLYKVERNRLDIV
ncbi:MAG: hypothetical protein P8N58_06940, partial [Emcibacteraceae bacterium]|nr:hypothetical protein [Emcibacteraceae bacterium]